MSQTPRKTPENVRFCWLSGASASAISVLQVQISGVQSLLGLDLGQLADAPAHNWLKDQNGERIDEVMASRVGQFAIVTTHGGPAVREAVTRALRSIGYTESHEQDMLANSPFEHEILTALMKVQGRAGVELALSALHRQGDFHKQCTLASERRLALADLANQFDKFIELPRIQLWGPVNAGKSSLLNALCGRELARVGSQPALTRDVIEGTLKHRGYELRLFDAPGEMANATGVDAAAIALAESWREQADLVIELVPPGAEPLNVGDWAYDSKADALPVLPERPTVSVSSSEMLGALKERLIRHFYGFDASAILALTPALREQLIAGNAQD
ncbi:MAG: GTPase [Planctomycetota bacterium]|jgi:tRNA U34 5-carboxymethylaminomethyl modifying GTPase MnmE/TrmE